MAEFKISRFRYTWLGDWSNGDDYIKDDVVRYGGSAWVCIRAHTASTFAEDQTYTGGSSAALPAWVKMADGYAWKGEWTEPTLYDPGDIIHYAGNLYLVTTSHTSTTTFDASLANLTVLLAGQGWAGVYGAWTSATRFGIGDIVRYNGIVYRCIEGHTSASTTNGLEADQAKWAVLFESEQYLGDWVTNHRYRKNDLVKFGGSIWRCKLGHTSANDSTLNFDAAEYWDIEFPGQQQSNVWNGTTVYQQGDVVQHGGYVYYSLTNNYNSPPGNSIYQIMDKTNPELDWQILSRGARFVGEWTDGAVYKTGDVVRRGGYTYVALLDTTADGSSLDYLDAGNWEIVAPSLSWKGSWTNGTTYAVGDIATYRGIAYSANVEHIADDQNYPGDNGSGYTFWDIVLYSADNLGMSTRGDLLTYDLSRGMAGDGSTFQETGVEIGEPGQLLSIDSEGSVYYKTWGDFENLIYVRSDGVDDSTDGNRGKNYFKPFKTIRYACEYVDSLNSDEQWAIRVWPGVYEEVLPIIVPKNTTLIGDEVRAVTVKPKLANTALANDANYTRQILARIATAIPDIVAGDDASRSIGNTATQVLPGANGTGSGILLNVTRNGSTYTATISSPGTGYSVNDLLLVLGEDLGGFTPANNLKVAVTAITELGEVTAISVFSGTALGTSIAQYPNVSAAITTPVPSTAAISDSLALLDTMSKYINVHVNGTDEEIPETTGSNTAVTDTSILFVSQIIADNKEFLASEAIAYMQVNNSSYTFDSEQCKRDVRKYIDAIVYDLTYPGNYKSILAARYYSNAVLGSAGEDMFYVRNSTGIRNMTLSGLVGDLAPANQYELYQRPTGGAYVSLDPGWGPDDERVWITSRSCYVQNCCTFGYAVTGQKIDGSLHNGGNKSIVSNDFTQIIGDGIGAYALNGGRAELVSVFTYYAQVGMFAEDGGIIRATNGNSSYGSFGALANGNDPAEVPKYGEVNARTGQASVVSAFAGEVNDEILRLEFTNAGQNYTSANYTFVGSGTHAEVVQEEFRDNAVFDVHIVPPSDSGTIGGSRYTIIGNNAQAGDLTTITIASNDNSTEAELLGLRIVLTSGNGTGQYGYVTAFNALTKLLNVARESDDQPGWDHIEAGYPLSTVLTTSTTYRFEPRPIFSHPGFTASTVTLSTTSTWSSVVYGETQGTYTNVVGSVGTGSTIGEIVAAPATWNVTKAGRSYTVTLVDAGAGYQDEQIVTIDGANVGGISGEHDVIITVKSVSDDSTNSITSFEYTGIAVSGRFVATPATGTTASSSLDGVTWENSTLPSAGDWNCTASGNNVFVALKYGSAAAAYSTDGLTWSASALPAIRNWTGVAYGNGIFLACSRTNSGAISQDGQTWVSTTLPTFGDSTLNEWVDIAYGKNTFVVLANSNNIVANGTWNSLTSTMSWDAHIMDSVADSSQKDWVSVAYGNNRFVAISSTGDISYSFDGENWLGGSMPTQDGSTAHNWNKIRYAQGVFFAVGDTGGRTIGDDPAPGGQTTFAATSYDGIVWTPVTLSAVSSWHNIAFGNPDVALGDSTYTNSSPMWIIVSSDSTNEACKVVTGARTIGRCIVEGSSITEIRIWEPGSGYTSPPTLTIIDPNSDGDVTVVNRMADGVLGHPSWINRGLGYKTSTTVVTLLGDGFADVIPVGKNVTLSGLERLPRLGAQFRFGGESFAYTVVAIEFESTEVDGTSTATFQISPYLTVADDMQHGTSVEIRERYSQVRITGHDFLDVGTGNFTETNYPTLYSTGDYSGSPENEVVEQNGGRVFYTATDQSGNFRTGELFAVEQATGIVTISADFFDLRGLTQLALGGVRLGGSAAVIREFSRDALFVADSNNIVPTQRAIKAYLASRLNIGGADLLTASFVAGVVRVGPNLINTTTGEGVVIPVLANFPGSASIFGSMLAQTMFYRSFKDDGQQ